MADNEQSRIDHAVIERRYGDSIEPCYPVTYKYGDSIPSVPVRMYRLIDAVTDGDLRATGICTDNHSHAQRIGPNLLVRSEGIPDIFVPGLPLYLTLKEAMYRLQGDRVDQNRLPAIAVTDVYLNEIRCRNRISEARIRLYRNGLAGIGDYWEIFLEQLIDHVNHRSRIIGECFVNEVDGREEVSRVLRVNERFHRPTRFHQDGSVNFEGDFVEIRFR
ncbi:hypothetical protein A2Y99_04530 [Candidatus Gottesmanbacteria bacterium RBG_13_37_7]|uniref:Uncharacterized protein n=1 Tax=Candidatus Gottesmanbacteria bacterium RBG_13_37_7 TaxID=1798369 RepID=A0A1F5YGA1_9BACT|nr:MAG: hypothetical protein A2Y99_04530 [Candidatus Gottesmanbacteria bacterium RBG_13_37_7]